MNPFTTTSYINPEYFCDRALESKQLLNAIKNGRNTTMVSLRKMGKTGLIKHVFYHLNQSKKYDTIYIDLYHTSNLKDFVNAVGTQILNSNKPTSLKIKSMIRSLLGSLRPILSFDAFNGEPSLSFSIDSEPKGFQTLNEIFIFLEKRSKIRPVVIALDEFQQITTYPEKNIEATLRSKIQHMQNVRFIFSGSNKHLLTKMFASAQRPFYQSTDFLHLQEIKTENYIHFISGKFADSKREIERSMIEYVLEWTRNHTYYVQYIFNRLFATNKKKLNNKVLNQLLSEILNEYELVYSEYRNLVTKHQWNLLIALAKEEGIEKITSAEFIKNHNLSNAATIRRSIKTLISSDLVFKKEKNYFVYDPFFMQWLNRRY